jgi:hypothetical protein
MNRSKPVLVVLIWIFSLSVQKVSLAQQPADCIAVITEISGVVLVKKINKTEFLQAFWGMQLFQGDQVKTFDKSGVSLLFVNSNLVKLDANSLIIVSGNESVATAQTKEVSRNISAAIMDNFSALAFRRDEEVEKGWMAGLRSGSEDRTIKLTSPYNTLIKTNRPAFTWIADKSFDRFNVNLYNSKGLVWNRKVSGHSMQYPDNEKELVPGETYYWNVEGEDFVGNDKSSSYRFSVLSAEKSKEVEGQEAVIMNTFRDEPEGSNLHSVLGAYYIKQGLLQDAITEFRIISSMNASAPLPHEILGSIYTEAGDKDKAIEELQKALELSKISDK